MKQLSVVQQFGQTGFKKKYTFFVAVGDLYEATIGGATVRPDRF